MNRLPRRAVRARLASLHLQRCYATNYAYCITYCAGRAYAQRTLLDMLCYIICDGTFLYCDVLR